jgi:hypothetical protein
MWNGPDAASGERLLVPLLLLTGQQLLLLLVVRWAAKFSNEKSDVLPDKMLPAFYNFFYLDRELLPALGILT